MIPLDSGEKVEVQGASVAPELRASTFALQRLLPMM